MDKPTVTGLPEEILLLVFAQLQPTLKVKSWKPCGKDKAVFYQSLARLCRVNKTCRRIATPLLYRTVELPGPAHIQHPAFSAPDGTKNKLNVKLFFRSIFRDPSLAQLVRRLKIECYGDTEVFPCACDDWPLLVLQGGLQYLHSLLPLSPDLQKTITNRVLEDYDDGMVAMLVPLCSNLEYLDLTLCQTLQRLPNTLLVRTISEIMESPQSTRHFSKLETLKIRQLDVQGLLQDEPLLQDEGFHLSHADQLLRLPALKTFRCRGAGGPWWVPLRENLEPLQLRSSNLVSMHLLASIIHSQEFVELLTAHPNLREFKFSEREASLLEIDHEAVFGALRQHGKKLKCLQFYACNVGGPPGDLRALDSLRELSIAQRSLFGAYDPESADDDLPALTDILPDSLTKLKIIPFRRSLPPLSPFGQVILDEDWDLPQYACTDFGVAFDRNLMALCKDKRFKKLQKVTLMRAKGVVSGFLPGAWTYSLDDAGWVRLRRGQDQGVRIPTMLEALMGTCDLQEQMNYYAS